MRHALLKEEDNEYEAAWHDLDFPETVDAYVDMLYILFGTLLVQVGQEKAELLWEEVHRTNMAKFADGVKLREDGKILKPEGWQPPDIAGILKEEPKEAGCYLCERHSRLYRAGRGEPRHLVWSDTERQYLGMDCPSMGPDLEIAGIRLQEDYSEEND